MRRNQPRKKGPLILVGFIAAIGAAIAVYFMFWAPRSPETPNTSGNFQTAEVTTGDLAQALSFKATVQERSTALPTTTVLGIQVALPPETIFPVMSAWENPGTKVTVKLSGRSKAVSCQNPEITGATPEPQAETLLMSGAAEKLIDAVKDAPEAQEEAPTDSAKEEQTNPPIGADLESSGPRLWCPLSLDYDAYLTEPGQVTISFTQQGKAKAVKLDGQVVAQTTTAKQTRNTVAAGQVDPTLLHRVMPVLVAKTATGEVLIPNEGRKFACDLLEYEISTAGTEPITTLICHVPSNENVYQGTQITVLVTLGKAANATLIPATAVRSTAGDKGVVTVVTQDGQGHQVLTDRTVALGITDGLSYEVKAGLNAQDQLLDPATQQ